MISKGSDFWYIQNEEINISVKCKRIEGDNGHTRKAFAYISIKASNYI